jgi:hypothetical protein
MDSGAVMFNRRLRRLHRFFLAMGEWRPLGTDYMNERRSLICVICEICGSNPLSPDNAQCAQLR